jgi:hypothetical protein
MEALVTHKGALEGLYCRPVVADSNDFNEEQDPDLDPYQREKLDLDPHLSEIETQIPIK